MMEVKVKFIPHSYAEYLKKQPIDELYLKLKIWVFNVYWMIGREYNPEFETGISYLRTVNTILDELRIRREIE